MTKLYRLLVTLQSLVGDEWIVSVHAGDKSLVFLFQKSGSHTRKVEVTLLEIKYIRVELANMIYADFNKASQAIP